MNTFRVTRTIAEEAFIEFDIDPADDGWEDEVQSEIEKMGDKELNNITWTLIDTSYEVEPDEDD